MYLVITKQSGEGCDYTIGCGINYEWIEAKDEEDVLRKLLGDAKYYIDSDSEYCLSNIFIVGAEHVVDVNVEKLINDHKNSKMLAEKNKEKQEELAELKRLKDKYFGNELD